MVRRLHVGVLGTGVIAWGGGVDLLRIILGALGEKERSGQIRLTLLLPRVENESTWRDFLYRGLSALGSRRPLQRLREVYWQAAKGNPHKVTRHKILDVLAQAGAKYNIRCYTGQDKLPELIRRQKIDAIVPSIVSLGADFPVPWVGYLCDFQHKHLPNLFSPEECSSRDHAFACMLEQAPAIMVTSQAVKRDIETFNPAGTHTVFALPFAPLPHNEWFGDDRANVVQKYGLPARYFLISSQFWRHKSHVTAFEALALLRQQANYQDVKVVCTGQTQDYRHPGYFDELQSRIADLGLTDAVVVLGHIPKLDQIQIMKQAVALVQPTLFEGSQGGLAVYDAVGLGVRAIVSDIPVNLEIQDSYVTFFQTGSAEDLAIKMAKILGEAAPRIDKRHQLKRAEQRITLFGDILLQAVAAARQPNGPNKLDTHEPTLQSVI